ncbi:unnamed protein product [Acanthoscelides obtectus]|uniref:Endonuclease/exonuclease/phosphatase domain-containing protein n=1 Tax=Acanthoscelides obtectus TaxID=200917 RepID=A0A9P0LT37_ACAOB|nr:unnamed protein product [Acanthoscelides obtectus]CAK1670916.1 hypothetical protein AOBTE_LOCUS27916 [Acanthoscelides obtectus]
MVGKNKEEVQRLINPCEINVEIRNIKETKKGNIVLQEIERLKKSAESKLKGRLTFERDGVLYGITCVYRPPPISKKDFTHDLHTYLKHISSGNIEIFLGDININILDNKDTLGLAVETNRNNNCQKSINSIKNKTMDKQWNYFFSEKRDKMNKRLLAHFSLSLENQYKDYRNKLNKLIRKQKNNYYRMQMEKNKNNMKKLYDVIKDATYEKSYKGQSYISINDNDGNQFTDSIEMVNFFVMNILLMWVLTWSGQFPLLNLSVN